jgi:hypothetical protein
MCRDQESLRYLFLVSVFDLFYYSLKLFLQVGWELVNDFAQCA